MTLRKETEWVELVENKVNTLVGSDKNKIIEACNEIKMMHEESFSLPLYGNRDAGKIIIENLLLNV